ncbi:MAG: hypothetical protein ACLQVX_14665 [Limisphaerales bacterium]
MTTPLMRAARPRREPPAGNPDAALFPVRSKRSLIQWTTERQIREVSRQLAKINQVAIRSETDGDYFKSGDLAYQVQEIIRSTAQLFKKSQRAKYSIVD